MEQCVYRRKVAEMGETKNLARHQNGERQTGCRRNSTCFNGGSQGHLPLYMDRICNNIRYIIEDIRKQNVLNALRFSILSHTVIDQRSMVILLAQSIKINTVTL